VRGERVRIDNLEASYWAKHYAGAVRYLSSKVVAQNGETPAAAPAKASDDATAGSPADIVKKP
jgi:hypothetical protein